MRNVYVVKLGKLYFKEKERVPFGKCRYTMTDNLDDTSFSEVFDSAEKLAEEIGGKVYKINLEEVE